MFNTPILLVIFNRPDSTKKLFNVIKTIKPKKLYIAADGPRAHKLMEYELCFTAREVFKSVDWDCDVHTRFSDENLGCKKNVSGGITWFLGEVGEGIILEDDCIPDVSFFPFCEKLLEKYRNTPQIKMISGNNFQFGNSRTDASYYFSKFPSIWGWATWERAWKDFDIDMKPYPQFKKDKKIQEIFDNKKIQSFLMRLFDNLYHNKMNTWAGRWLFAILNSDGISITPNVNLVTNIGFTVEATHTKSNSVMGNIPTENIKEIVHPSLIKVNKKADEHTFKNIFYQPLHTRVKNKLKKYITIWK